MFQRTAVRMTSHFPLFHFMSHSIQMRRLMMPFNGIYKRYLSDALPQPVTTDNNRHFIKATSLLIEFLYQFIAVHNLEAPPRRM